MIPRHVCWAWSGQMPQSCGQPRTASVWRSRGSEPGRWNAARVDREGLRAGVAPQRARPRTPAPVARGDDDRITATRLRGLRDHARATAIEDDELRPGVCHGDDLRGVLELGRAEL